MATPGPVCKLCSAAVTRGDQRRNLGSPSSKHVVDMLMELLQGLFPQHVLPELTAKMQRSFLCRACFRSVEKLIEVNKSMQELKGNLEV